MKFSITKRVLTPDEIVANYKLGTGTYYWRVIADDGTYQTTSSTWHFDAGSPTQDVDPPSITLNYPADGASAATNHMEVSTTVQDASPPMKVWIYGGTTSSATDMLCARTNVSEQRDGHVRLVSTGVESRCQLHGAVAFQFSHRYFSD